MITVHYILHNVTVLFAPVAGRICGWLGLWLGHAFPFPADAGYPCVPEQRMLGCERTLDQRQRVRIILITPIGQDI